MKNNAEYFLKRMLGSDFLKSLDSSLSKSEIYKPGSKTVIETSDMYQGLKLVPKVLMKLLISELVPMQIGETKELTIPIQQNTIVRVTKHERDSLSGEVLQNNIKIAEFMHRSIPGIGLVLLSALELYDLEDLDEEHSSIDKEDVVNKLIDERLHLHSLINKVVDGKLMQRDAVQQLFMAKLNELSQEHKKISEEHKEIAKPAPTVVVIETKKKSLPLSEFVENRKKKLNKKEHFINLEKSETVSCPDCGKDIFINGAYSGCICLGIDMDKKLFIGKSDNGINVRFGRGWSPDNIEMLLEVLRSKKNE